MHCTQECQKLGIAGAAIRQELQQLSSKLPGLFTDLVQQLRSPDLDAAIKYYQHFTQYAHSGDAGKARAAAAADANGQQQHELPHVLNVLMEIREHRTVPHTASTAANNAAADGTSGPGIYWGGLDLSACGAGGTTGTAGIDWGAELEAGAGATDAAAAADGGISWDLGDLDTTAAATGGDGAAGVGAAAAEGISWDVAVEPQEGGDEAAAAGAAAPTLDWDIDLSGIGVESAGESLSAAAAPGIDWGIDVGEPGSSDAAAGGDAAGEHGGTAAAGSSSHSGNASADRLQHDSEYRSQLQDDLQVWPQQLVALYW